jgi:hypothetical protein
MRCTQVCGIGVLALLVGLALGSAASAQIAPPQSGAKKLEKAELVAQLRAAHKLLAEADRDYDGHRARAAEAVHKAIRELVGNHHPKKPPTGTAAAVAKKSPAVHEPQAASDAQLRQAQGILQGVQGELSTRHPKAAEHISLAIGELNTALKIK